MKLLSGLVPLLFFTVISCSAYESAAPRARTAEEIEKPEFDALIKKDSLEKHQTAAESLDVLLNEGYSGNKVSVIIRNNSNCNIIVRFSGAKYYNMPILKNNKNFIVVEKGTYSLGANLCRSRYSSSRTFDDSITLTLSESSQ